MRILRDLGYLVNSTEIRANAVFACLFENHYLRGSPNAPALDNDALSFLLFKKFNETLVPFRSEGPWVRFDCLRAMEDLDFEVNKVGDSEGGDPGILNLVVSRCYLVESVLDFVGERRD